MLSISKAAISDKLNCDGKRGDSVHELEVRLLAKGKPGERLDITAESTMESLGLRNGSCLHATPVFIKR